LENLIQYKEKTTKGIINYEFEDKESLVADDNESKVSFDREGLTYHFSDIGNNKENFEILTNFNTIVFFFNLCEYDNKEYTENNKELLQELSKNKNIKLEKTSILIILKKPLNFEEKIKNVDMKEFYSNYDGKLKIKGKETMKPKQ
jgi:hypothetical protein